MQRIMQPLAQMGARIEARDGRFPPLTIHGGKLHAIDYTLPMASAQVKSCVLLAGLFAEGQTTVHEPMRTRDHTELALREFGAEVEVRAANHHRHRAAAARRRASCACRAIFLQPPFSWWPR